MHNRGTTTKYFKLDKGARQGDPISAYLFILVLDIAFTLKKIKTLRALISLTMYSAYADDTFSVSGENSVIKVMNAFDRFLILSGLKPTKEKCEIIGTGALKGVSLAVCLIDRIDLTKNQKFWVHIFLIIKNVKLKRTLSGMFEK